MSFSSEATDARGSESDERARCASSAIVARVSHASKLRSRYCDTPSTTIDVGPTPHMVGVPTARSPLSGLIAITDTLFVP